MQNNNLLLLVILFFFELVFILKLVRLSTYLFYPSWKFDKNFTIAPLIKNKNYILSWAFTILLRPLIVALGGFKDPVFLIEYLRVLFNKETYHIILTLIYFSAIALVGSGLIEKKLPRNKYKSKKQLIIDITVYFILFISIFILKITSNNLFNVYCRCGFVSCNLF